MALHALLDAHLQRVLGTSGYTVSGAVATVTGSLDHRAIQELVNVASELKHDVVVTGGSPKVQPR